MLKKGGLDNGNGGVGVFIPLTEKGAVNGVATLGIDSKVPLTQLPTGALPVLVVVADQVARFALTTTQVQNGDTVKQVDTNLMYYVVDDTNLNNASGYDSYDSTTDWSLITSKPANITEIEGIIKVNDDLIQVKDGVYVARTPAQLKTDLALTKADVGLPDVNNTSDPNKPISTATQTALNLKADLNSPTFTGTVALPSTTSIGNVSSTELGYVDGVTSAIQTQLNAKIGTWNASTNTPTLANGVGNTGDTYIVSVAGTQNLGSGNITFAIGDFALYNGTAWEKVLNSNAVTSVFGRTGAITAQSGDYLASQVTFQPSKLVYISPFPVGVDAVGNGGINKPYRTIQYALNQITDAGITIPYLLVLDPSNYVVGGDLTLKPNVSIDLNESILWVTGNILPDASFMTSNSLTTIKNGHLRVDGTINFDLSTKVAASYATDIFFESIHLFKGGGAANVISSFIGTYQDTIYFDNCTFNNSSNILFRNCTGFVVGGTYGTITLENTGSGFCRLDLQSGLEAALLIKAIGAGLAFCNARALSYSQVITIDGSNTILNIDTIERMPTLLNGATFNNFVFQTFRELTDAATIAFSTVASNNANLVLGDNRMLGNPSNPIAGASGIINVRQGSVGSKTLSYDWGYEYIGGVQPVLTAGAYSLDRLEYTINSASSSTVTISLATPGVITWPSHKLKSGQKIRFTTTGTLPNGLALNTTYWVNVTGPDTFNVSASLLNLRISTFAATSGPQSGVHTATHLSVLIRLTGADILR